jgi:hypothetical protein
LHVDEDVADIVVPIGFAEIFPHVFQIRFDLLLEILGNLRVLYVALSIGNVFLFDHKEKGDCVLLL